LKPNTGIGNFDYLAIAQPCLTLRLKLRRSIQRLPGAFAMFPQHPPAPKKTAGLQQPGSQAGRKPVRVHRNRYPFGVYIQLRNFAQSLQSPQLTTLLQLLQQEPSLLMTMRGT
jgi:hypothetical protein